LSKTDANSHILAGYMNVADVHCEVSNETSHYTCSSFHAPAFSAICSDKQEQAKLASSS